MDASRARVAVIVGSTREGRLAGAVADWFTAEAHSRADLALEVIDLIEADLPVRHPEALPPGAQAFVEAIEAADAYVVITPEYNHGYPAALKHALDLPYWEWNAKPVGFVSYGGMAGGIRAVEQLRQVFAELHVVSVRDQVAIVDIDAQVDEAGQLKNPTRYQGAAKSMLDQLAWWAVALRQARAIHPYAA